MASQPSRSLRSHPVDLILTGIPVPSRRKTTMPSQELETAETSVSRKPATSHEDVETPEPENGSEILAADELRASTDVEDDSPDESDGETPHQISKKRARSLDSARKKLRSKKVVYLKRNELSSEQKKVVEAAANSLTQEQKSQVQRRQNRVEESNPPEPSTSRDKGKMIDPREWGNAGIPSDEISVEMQKALLEAYQRGREQAKERFANKKYKYSDESEDEDSGMKFWIPVVTRHKSVASSNPDLKFKGGNSKPAAQIVPDSSLGVALGNLARMNRDIEGPSDPSDSSDSDYESSCCSKSTRSSSRSQTRRKKRRRGSTRRTKKKSRSRRSSRRSSTSIKPIPPKDYDGKADARAYHRFVMEGEAYLRDGKVHRERQIRILAHHLDGKAYDFYMQKVATDDPKNWTLHKSLRNYLISVSLWTIDNEYD